MLDQDHNGMITLEEFRGGCGRMEMVNAFAAAAGADGILAREEYHVAFGSDDLANEVRCSDREGVAGALGAYTSSCWHMTGEGTPMLTRAMAPTLCT